MTKRNVMISILSSRLEYAHSLFEEENEEGENEAAEPMPLLSEMPEPTELLVEGRLVTGKDRVELVYEESEMSGMEGAVTSIGFDRANPGLITMVRSGIVETAMCFEEGKRHFSVYDTPFSSFQICVRGVKVRNLLLQNGTVELEYLIEIHGAQAERCRMTISAHPVDDPFSAEV